MTGYTALHEHAAWLDLSSRGSICAHGEDRLRLINAISTNDVASLSPGQGTYAFFLDAQGHILSDAHIFVTSDYVLLDCEPERADFLFGHVDRYIIMDDVSIENAAPNRVLIAVEGPGSEDLVAAATGATLPSPEPFSHTSTGALRILRASITGQPGIWLDLPLAERDEVISRLGNAGAIAAKTDDFRVVRVENRKPRYSEDFGNQALPQESGQMHAVSFDKGCYLGQEIVERVRSRGQVHRTLAAIEWDSEIPPADGSPIDFSGREAGRVSSPVYSPRHGCAMSFSILRSEAAQPGARLAAGDISGTSLGLC